MLKPGDLVYLPYTQELTQAGITYACRSLAHTFNRMGGTGYERLRRIASGKAVELAFQRLLEQEEIPYNTSGATPFTDPDRYDISLSGRRCDIKSFQFFNKHQIRAVHGDPAYLMEASALVPSDQAGAGRLSDQDLYVFAFMTALTATRPADLQAAAQRGQPFCFIHILPPAWLQPGSWRSLGRLALKSNAPGILTVEIGGQGAEGQFLTETLYLAPGKRIECHNDYYSVAYLYITHPPQGEIGIHSPALKSTAILPPESWENIWVYGMEIILAGYIPVKEYLLRARYLPPGSRVLQYAHTRTPNLSLPLAELHPLQKLFQTARLWNKVY